MPSGGTKPLSHPSGKVNERLQRKSIIISKNFDIPIPTETKVKPNASDTEKLRSERKEIEKKISELQLLKIEAGIIFPSNFLIFLVEKDDYDLADTLKQQLEVLVDNKRNLESQLQLLGVQLNDDSLSSFVVPAQGSFGEISDSESTESSRASVATPKPKVPPKATANPPKTVTFHPNPPSKSTPSSGSFFSSTFQ